MADIVPLERIASKIYFIRGMKVMLDRDLAELYGVQTKVLKQAVRRNVDRFPDDFMFEMTKTEFSDWRSQFVTSKSEKMGLRHKPMVFTEQGVAMLSSVLKSGRAIQVNIQIMRAFTQLRKMLSTHEDLKRKIESMERKYDQQFQIVFDAIKQLLEDVDITGRLITPNLSVSSFKNERFCIILKEFYRFIFLKFETLRDCRSYRSYGVRCRHA